MVSSLFKVRKVLMRSDQDNLVVVTTNNTNCPVILYRPGKPGAWFPQRGEMPYGSIFDVVFHGNHLYGITVQLDLVALGRYALWTL
ncbi:hypothetical protein ZWY2020_024934 [Hordeum vulgare]|nr:hypothetical protein ZWY2020_024934 [Hordeum vulgare]